MFCCLAPAVVGFVLAATSPAEGEEEEEEEAPLDASDPAEQGVSDDARAEARELFRTGNGFFERDEYAQALEHYRDAVELWDYPAIHFNIAVCLINLDQPVAAYEHLERALEHGGEGLGPHFHTQAITYKKLLLGRLARLEVECPQRGVEVTLDGKHLLSCPGTKTRYLLPGEHQLVAEKGGFVPVTRALDLRAGGRRVETLTLSPPSVSTRYERRWKPWVPWVPTAAGTAVGLIGIGMRVLAVSHAEQFDREVARLCPQGCAQEDLPESVRQLRSRAGAENAVGITLLAVGGAAVVTGMVLFVLNRRREVRQEPPPVALTLGSGSVGVSLRTRW
jgi:hypothetical protein